MQKRKIIGYSLVLVGILLIAFTPQLTGAVVGISNQTGFTFGLLLIVVGGVVLLVGGMEELEELIKNKNEFVESNFKGFRTYLEKGEFNDQSTNVKEKYEEIRNNLLDIPVKNRDAFARDQLCYMADEEGGQTLKNYQRIEKEIYKKNVAKKNLAQQVLDSGKVLTKSSELKSIASKMKLAGRGVKEGWQVLNKDGKPLTVIPKSPTVSDGVYRSVLKALATGQSSLRRRTGYTSP